MAHRTMIRCCRPSSSGVTRPSARAWTCTYMQPRWPQLQLQRIIVGVGSPAAADAAAPERTRIRRRRYSSSIFRDSLRHNLSNDERKEERTQRGHIVAAEGGGRGSDNGRKERTNDGDDRHRNRTDATRFHSVRLVGESAARETTRLFVDAHNSAMMDNGNGDAVTTATLWKGPSAPMAAERALEFWATRNNNARGKSGRLANDRRQAPRSPEEDADTAYELFAAVHYFHGRDGGGLLTNGMYSYVIDALAKGGVDHVAKADALLRQFISLYVARRGGTRKSFALSREVGAAPALETGASSIVPMTAAPDGIEWTRDRYHYPNQVRITGVMRGHARHSDARGAESLLDLMVRLSSHRGGGDDNNNHERAMFLPNEVGYATVIDAYSRVPDGENAERVLRLMKARPLSAADDDGPQRIANAANVVAYNSAISAWARCAKRTDAAGADLSSRDVISRSREAAMNAERLLREMHDEHGMNSQRDGRLANSNTLLPDVVTYSTVIAAYVACLDQPHGMERARELLTELEELAMQEYNDFQNAQRNACDKATIFRGDSRTRGGRSPNGFRPNTTVYNTLLQAYANAGDAAAAEAMLGSMMKLVERGGGGPYQHVRPNTRTFNVVLNALSKKGGGDAGRKASEILEQMETMSANGNGLARPDVISYNTVLAAWSKSACVDSSTSLTKDGGDAQQSSNIVGESAAYEALKLLDRIEAQRNRSGQSRRNDIDHSRDVKPDVISYSTTIAAFANAASHCRDGLRMAEETELLLTRMKDRMGIEPDTYSYNGVLLAWARSSGGLFAARRAESILRLMRDPTNVSWSTVITAYSQADDAARAEELLREVEENAQQRKKLLIDNGVANHAITPSIVLCNNVLHAWGTSSDKHASKRALRLLDDMDDDTSSLPKPDTQSYNLVLTVLQHSKDGDKAQRARSVLHKFLKSNEGRNKTATQRDIQNAYNCVLTAATYTPEDAGKRNRSEAVRILAETLRDMNLFPWSSYEYTKDSITGPNQESYALFVQGCTHLYESDSDERNILLQSAFRECCHKGLLNRIIWDKFCSAMPQESIEACIDGVKIDTLVRTDVTLDYESLPGEWSMRCEKA